MNLSDFWARFGRYHVRVYADFIDPFCYVGVHNLYAALEPSSGTLDWRGFELNPQTPPEGMLLQTAENSDLRAGMWASVDAYARRSGLTLREPRFVPNTRRAQLLVRSAPSSVVKKSLIERIYRAYFIDQKNIGEIDVLRAIAQDVRMPVQSHEPALAEAFPNGEKLERLREEAKQRTFPGMPGFVYRNRTHFGALPKDFWSQLLNPQKGSDHA